MVWLRAVPGLLPWAPQAFPILATHPQSPLPFPPPSPPKPPNPPSDNHLMPKGRMMMDQPLPGCTHTRHGV
jgi:hypothetical protein